MKFLMLKLVTDEGISYYVRKENDVITSIIEKPLRFLNVQNNDLNVVKATLNETLKTILERELGNYSIINDTITRYVSDNVINSCDFSEIDIIKQIQDDIMRKLEGNCYNDYSFAVDYSDELYNGLFLNPNYRFANTDFDDLHYETKEKLEDLGIISACDNCGDYHFSNEMTHTEEGNVYCENCDDCYFLCDGCGCYCDSDEVYTVLHNGYREEWCRDCVDNSAHWIDDVDCYVHEDDIVSIHTSETDINRYFDSEINYARENYYYDEDHDTWWTGDCWDDENDRSYYYDDEYETEEDCDEEEYEQDRLYVHEYSHTFSGLKFFGDEDDNGINGVYGGFELEITKKSREANEDYFLNAITPIAEDRLLLKRDGSINGNFGYGIEIVSMPHTFEEFWKQKERWEIMLKTAVQQHYVSHDSNKAGVSCGLHFHVSRTLFGNDESTRKNNIAKVMYFVDRYYDDIAKISRRRREDLNDWARRYNADNYDEALDSYDSYNYGAHGDRYKAVNITNRTTVEYRMMRGTLKPETFFACIDFLMTISNNSVNIREEDLDNVNLWLNGIKPETLKYIRNKNAFENLEIGGNE